MTDVIDLMVSFPTVVFTVPLVFCFLWFLLGFVVSGARRLGGLGHDGGQARGASPRTIHECLSSSTGRSSWTTMRTPGSQ